MLKSKRWLDILDRIAFTGDWVDDCLETENFQFIVPDNPYMVFPQRKLSLSYIREELKWYINGDPRDMSIVGFASKWKDHILDEKLNSNYGYYLFALGGLNKALAELISDPYSRRAFVTILDSHKHLPSHSVALIGQRDVPCTIGMSFRIRCNRLNMTVTMRSNDVWFGLGNDAPFFDMVHSIALWILRITYPALTLGDYVHCAHSMHIYKRNFNAVMDILEANEEPARPAQIPRISSTEEAKLITELHNPLKVMAKSINEARDDPESGTRAIPFVDWLYQ